MNWKDFNPTDSTGPNDSDMLFRMDITGPQGARYQLLKEVHHTGKDTKKAMQYIRRNFDPVHIQIIKETK